VPLGPLVCQHWGALLAGNAAVICCFAIFYMATAYALAQGTGGQGAVVHYRREAFLGVQLAANAFLALGIVVAAVWSDRASPERVLAWGAVAAVALGLGFGAGLGFGSLWAVFGTLGAALFIMGLVYGPLGGWLPHLFPVALRYSGISIAFSAGGIVGGAVTPILATHMAAGGHAAWVGLLISAAGLVSLLGVLAGKRVS